MSDPASRKSEPQISKFAASQTASRQVQPTIGDISAIQSEIEDPKSSPQSVGNFKDVNSTSANEVLSDITLLEEAFAEMEDSVDDTADNDDDIPMLHSTIEQPTTLETAELPANDESIPVLNQQATEFVPSSVASAENLQTESNNEEIADIPTLSSDLNIELAMDEPELNSKPASEPVAVSEMKTASSADAVSQAVDNDDFDFSGLDLLDEDEPEAAGSESMAPVVTTFDAISEQNAIDNPSAPQKQTSNEESIWAEDIVASEPAAFSNSAPKHQSKIEETISGTSSFTASNADINKNEPETPSIPAAESTQFDNVFTSETTHTSIEEKIAQASGDVSSVTGFNDIPLSNEQMSGFSETELAPGFVEELTKTHVTTPVGELVPQTEEQESKSGPDSAFHMSIPFELHSQLSKKIDELVLDATMSLTTELENQLSQQLESLLGNAVESVLPKLIDQMANELRYEVKGRVKQQLPIIVNDVLGKTRLS